MDKLDVGKFAFDMASIQAKSHRDSYERGYEEGVREGMRKVIRMLKKALECKEKA